MRYNMEYNELTDQQKEVIKSIESTFFYHASLTKQDYIIALVFVLNKFKK